MSGSNLNQDVVENVSKLAKLKLTPEEIREFSVQLSNVLENFEQISQVETHGVRPLVTPTEITLQLRADVVLEEGNEPELLLQNAPDKSGRLFKVPPVV